MTRAPSLSLNWLQDLKFDWLQVQLTFRLVLPVFRSTAQLGINWLLKWGHFPRSLQLHNFSYQIDFKKWRWNQTSCLKMTQIDLLWVKTKIIFSEEVNDPPIHIEGVKCQDPVFFYFCKNRCDNTTSSVKPNARVVWFDCKDELEKGYLPSNMLSLETCDDS